MRKLLFMCVVLSALSVLIHAQDASSSASKPAPQATGVAPVQPIAFDHKLHAETAKMTCNDCHAERGNGSTVAMPQAPKCMTCHASVATDKPDIQRLAAAAKNEEPIAWTRVYRVPSFVTFSHKTHAGSTCEECHGPVAQRTAISLEKDTHMGTCIACHAAKQAPTGCDTCHGIMSKNGKMPFDVDGPALARLQLAGRKPAIAELLLSGTGSKRPFDALAGFLYAPAL
ncbi:cytochrome c3 family protein [Granulicella arctica]|uniref:cytochrome c3 family protein n=1 Tax=Granulicella arctica TaxID=940613 RepID=UPI0021E055AB|nr:cytochrome c3 family protein [Granulicella arctica]